MIAITLTAIQIIKPPRRSINNYQAGYISINGVGDTDTSAKSLVLGNPKDLVFDKNITGLFLEFTVKGDANTSGIAYILWNNQNGTTEIQRAYRDGSTYVALSKPEGGFVLGKNIVILVINQETIGDVRFTIQ